MQKTMLRTLLMTAVGAMALAAGTVLGYTQVGLPLDQLPQDHEYQQKLRTFLGTLTEKDFEVERRDFTLGPTNDLDHLYRMWLLRLDMPQLGVATLPASAFTLKALESGKGIMIPCPPNASQSLAWLAAWDYPGNPYRGSRALKLRAFVLAAVDLVMLDALYEKNPQGAARADYLGGNLIWIGYTYRNVRDILPPEALAAFEAGIKKQVLRLVQWGPTGAMTDMDLFAPVGLSYITQALANPEVKQAAEKHSRRLFTDARHFHPAGYFVDVGCFDTSYNGISLYFAAWAALLNEWPFAREALDKAFRLRAHLCFPDPDGTFEGPSHMSSRTSADPPRDQWNFPHRPYAAAMATDEAIHLAPLPPEDQIRAAPAWIVNVLNAQMTNTAAAQPQTWKESHWCGSSLNFAYDLYKSGAYAKQLALANTPIVKPLYMRNETFVREFEKVFVIARFEPYALAIHTGPVRGFPNGFGGGQLSVFWTPATGTILLGRRGGMQGHAPDKLEEWRTWPIHAVSGLTTSGTWVSSAAIPQPEVQYDTGSKKAAVRVAGAIPKTGLRYERRFTATPKALTVETALASDGQDTFVELYETIPVFLKELSAQSKATPTSIEFRVGDQWSPGTAEARENVDAIRLNRFDGAVEIRFSRPRRVKLSPKDWADAFQTRASCRTILVDLLAGAGKPLKSASVSYTIMAVPAPAKPAAGP